MMINTSLMMTSVESILIDNSEHFDQSNFLFDFVRMVGWAIVKFLRFFAHGSELLIDAAYEFLDITQSNMISSFLDEFGPLLPISLTVSFIVLGLIYMFSDKRPKVFHNLFLGLLVLFGFGTATTYLNEAIQLSRGFFMEQTSATDDTIRANITDLLYMDENGWDFDGATQFNSLTSNAITFLDPSEHVSKKSEVSSTGKEIFNTYFVINPSGDLTTESIGTKGWFDIFDPPYYYRYKIHFFQIYVLLIANIMVFIVVGYKVFKIVHELIVTRAAGSLLAGDLTSGQRIKKVIEAFFSCYICLFFILVCFKLYKMYQQYINNQDWLPLVRMFMLLFAALTILDGPNIIEKLFGMDIGLSNEMFKLMSLGRAGAMAAGIGGRLASGAGSLANGLFGGKGEGGDFRNNNPNNDGHGETKEPNVDPSNKPEEGPYANRIEPNGQTLGLPDNAEQSHSDSSDSGNDANYHMNAAMGHGGEESNGGNNPNHDSPQEDSPDSGHNAFDQDSVEPNEDPSTGNNEDPYKDLNKDFTDGNDLHGSEPGQHPAASNMSENGSDSDSVDKQAKETQSNQHKPSQAQDSLSQAGQTGADEMRMGKQTNAGAETKNTSAGNGSGSVGFEKEHNQEPGQRNNQPSGQASSSPGTPGTEKLRSENTVASQPQGPGQSSQQSGQTTTEMGALRSENVPSSQPRESGVETPGTTSQNEHSSGSLNTDKGKTKGAGPETSGASPTGKSTQPGGHNQTSASRPSPEQEKASLLDQKWGIDDIKPNVGIGSHLNRGAFEPEASSVNGKPGNGNNANNLNAPKNVDGKGNVEQPQPSTTQPAAAAGSAESDSKATNTPGSSSKEKGSLNALNQENDGDNKTLSGLHNQSLSETKINAETENERATKPTLEHETLTKSGLNANVSEPEPNEQKKDANTVQTQPQQKQTGKNGTSGTTTETETTPKPRRGRPKKQS